MRSLAGAVLWVTVLWCADAPSVVQADRKGIDLGALGLHVTAVKEQTPVQVVRQGPDRVLITPVAARIEVSRGKILLARLHPGRTYYFEEDKTEKDSDQSSPKSSANQSPGLSRKVKWGIAGGIAAGAGVGLKLALDEPEPVSRR